MSLTLSTRTMPAQGAVAKRLVDIILSAAGLVIVSPILLIASIAVRLTSPGCILFEQMRVGKDCEVFTIYKFRSMVADAEATKGTLVNERDGPAFKVTNDPRVTPVGHFIRKFAIDELPQLWNILRGDMSFVGPRPPLPSEVVNYSREHMRRLDGTPGLICTWQISPEKDTMSFDEWVRLDVEYLKSPSLSKDVNLILRTIPYILLGRHSA